MKILNTWNSNKEIKKFYTVDKPVFSFGDYSIYKICDKNYLYTYKDIAINNLTGLNKDHLKRIALRNRPAGKYSPSHFIYDRAINTIESLKQ